MRCSIEGSPVALHQGLCLPVSTIRCVAKFDFFFHSIDTNNIQKFYGLIKNLVQEDDELTLVLQKPWIGLTEKFVQAISIGRFFVLN